MKATQATWKRIFCSIDKDYKNHHTFDNGTTIRQERFRNEFDRRITQPVNGTVIQSHFIPSGAECLLHHNAAHATYEIFDYKELDGSFLSGNLRYFSIPESECYAWRIDGDWQPCHGFAFGLRVFKPYTGSLSSILPIQVKNKLFITSGEYAGKVAMTAGHSDYEIVFRDRNGKEQKLIRLRHFEEPENIREEIFSIDHETTDKVLNNEYLIGFSPVQCQKLNIEMYAD